MSLNTKGKSIATADVWREEGPCGWFNELIDSRAIVFARENMYPGVCDLQANTKDLDKTRAILLDFEHTTKERKLKLF